MNGDESKNLIFTALSVFGVVVQVLAWIKYRERKELKNDLKIEGKLKKWQSIGCLCLPSLVVGICTIVSLGLPRASQHLWFGVIFILICPSLFLSSITAEWLGVPLNIRQAGSQVVWGVILCLIVMIIITGITEILSI